MRSSTILFSGGGALRGFQKERRQTRFAFLTTFYLILMMLWPKFLSIDTGVLNINPSVIMPAIIIVVCIPVIIRNIKLNRRGADFHQNHIVTIGLFVAFYASVIVSDVLGDSSDRSLYLSLRAFLNNGAAFVIGLALFGQPAVRRRIRWVLLWGAIVIALVGIHESWNNLSLLYSIGIFRFASNPDVAQGLVESGMRGGDFRPISLTSHCIVFGQGLAALLPFILDDILQPSGRRRLAILALVLMTWGILISTARSAIVVAATSVTSYLFFIIVGSVKRFRLRLMMPFILCIIGAGTLYMSLDYFQSLIIGDSYAEVQSSYARIVQLNKGLEVFYRKLCWGFGDGMDIFLAGIPGSKYSLSVDNYYLTLIMNFGVVGLSLFLAFFAAIILQVFCRSIREPLADTMIAPCVGAILGILVGQSVISIYDNLFYAFLLSGVIVAAGKSPWARRALGNVADLPSARRGQFDIVTG